MSEHQMKDPLPKSVRKPQSPTQNGQSTAEGANSELIRLQRLVGNQAVQRMLATHQIQAKMTVGAADDPYEREADAVASQVMAKRDVVQRESADEDVQMKRVDIVQRIPEDAELLRKPIDIIQRDEGGEAEEEEIAMKRMDTIQRDEGGEAEEEEIAMKRMDTIQRDEGGEAEEEEIAMKRADVWRKPVDMSGSFDVNQDIEGQIQSASGSGQSIPDVNRDMFESSMGHDFSGVKVHTDTQSDGLNRDLGARAFTTGSDIFFRQGEYNPESSDGQRLLAHELTHVVQQGGAGVKKKAEEE
jgi:hypothetical protein